MKKIIDIKKPVFWSILIKCFIALAIFAFAAVIIFGRVIYSNLALELRSFDEDISYTRKQIQKKLDGELESDTFENDLLMYFWLDNADVKIVVDKECIADCSQKIRMNLGIEQENYISSWSGDMESIKELSDYCHMDGILYRYEIGVDSYYDDASTATRYPCDVSVYRINNISSGKKLVKTYHLIPEDKILNSCVVVTDNKCKTDVMYVTTESAEEFYISYEYVDVNGDTHLIEYFVNNDETISLIKARTMIFVIELLILISVLGLVIGTCFYYKSKYTYETFEHNRITTEAMAHDLKTPLSVISIYAENLEEYMEIDTNQCKKYIKYIKDNIDYMNGVIVNISGYSKSCNMKAIENYSKIDVRAEIEKYIDLIKPSIEKNNLTINITGNTSQVTDIKLWNQSVFNVIENAVKYATQNSEIEIVLTHSGLTVSNKVDDDIEDTDKLLKPFVKGEFSRSNIDGNGLGLAIVDNNIKRLGYKLSVTCKDKTFVVKIC